MNREQIMQLKLTELKDLCQELNLSTSGNRKAKLQERLFEHFNIEDEEFVEASTVKEPSPNFTLKDIQDYLNYFDGSGQPEIDDWLKEFEENAEVVQWSELQKLVYGKQLLKGAALTFVRSQPNVQTWKSLKLKLQKEFGTYLTTAERHKILCNIQKKQNESLLELLYRIIEIGNPIDIDEESIVEYFANAISDSKNNKLILYEATSIEDLKSKIKIYEKIKKPNTEYFNKNFKSYAKCPNLRNHSTEECRKNITICQNCGRKGHRTNNCRSNWTSPKGNFPNQNFIKRDPEPSPSNNYRNNNNQNYSQYRYNSQTQNRYQQQPQNNNPKVEKQNQYSTNQFERPQARVANVAARIFKKIKIQNVELQALIDTGSDFCFIKKSAYDKLKNIKLIPDVQRVRGLGQGFFTTLGYILVPIKIDKIEIEWHFHVAYDSDLTHVNFIGNDILRIVDINLNSQGATFQLKEETKCQIENEKENEANNDVNIENGFLAGIEFKALCTSLQENYINEVSQHLQPSEKEKLEYIITNYQPFQRKESPVSMSSKMMNQSVKVQEDYPYNIKKL